MRYGTRIWTAAAVAAMGLATMGFTGVVHAEAGSDQPLAGPNAPAAGKEGKGFSGERKGPHGPFAVLFKDLNLTEEQRTKVRTIMEEHKTRYEAWREKNGENPGKALREQMKAAREAGDKEKMKQLMEEAKKLHEGAPKPGEVVAAIRPVLTEEQQKTFDANVEQWKKEMQSRRGEMGKGPMKDGEHPQRSREGKGNKSDGAATDSKLNF